MSEPRCERSDLPASMCSHCRGHDAPERRHTRQTSWGVPEVWASFPARYESRCGRCGGLYRAGETITPCMRTGPDRSGVEVTRRVWLCEECMAAE